MAAETSQAGSQATGGYLCFKGVRLGRTLLFLALFILMVANVYGKPAPWYQWESKVDGKRVCKQTTPGPDWKVVAGPFPDARCIKQIVR